jgi:hypothetical protein
LLAANAEIARQKTALRRETDEFEAAIMRRPLAPAAAYGWLGLMLGTLPPAAIFLMLFKYGSQHSFALVGLLLMNVVCAAVGYQLSKSFGTACQNLETKSWTKMLLLMPFIGATWGIITGAAGGLLFFGIGSFFGMLVALPIGAIAFTLFAILHRLMSRAGQIERKHLLPFAVGVSAIISAFILGM